MLRALRRKAGGEGGEALGTRMAFITLGPGRNLKDAGVVLAQEDPKVPSQRAGRQAQDWCLLKYWF